MTEELKPCSAVPCNCEGVLSNYIVTYPNGEERYVSKLCANMAIMAGYKCRSMEIKGE